MIAAPAARPSPVRHRTTVESSGLARGLARGPGRASKYLNEPKHQEETEAVASSIPLPAEPVVAEPTVAELTLGEQLVIWALRKRLESVADRPALRRGFLLAGAGGLQALAAFEQLFAAIESHCRRDLWFHRCGCGCVSADELRILGLIAAQQSGEVAAALGHGSSLVVLAAVGEIVRAAGAFGQALAACGLTLPLRVRCLPERPAADRGRLH
jgi:hypothetical protein